MIGTFFASTINKVFAGVTLVLLTIIAILYFSLAAEKRTSAANMEKHLACEAAHKVTAASFEAVVTQLESYVAQGEMRKTLLEEAKKKAEQETADLQDEADALRGQRVDDECRSPTSVIKSRGL